jgi:ribonuclease-3
VVATILSKVNRMQEIVGYRFKDPELLRAAITHPSAIEGKPVSAGYERLEFLGDSVVGFVVAEELYEQFPEMDEGGLTRLKVSLISGESLAAVAAEHGFADLIVFGSSERGTGSRGLRSALENVYEAVCGALYLDGGLEPVRAWVRATLQPHLAPSLAAAPENPKSLLQEKTQASQGHETPSYALVSTGGPAHSPVFVCDCLVAGRTVGRGEGSSKKEAEAFAAAQALVTLGYLEPREGCRPFVEGGEGAEAERG